MLKKTVIRDCTLFEEDCRDVLSTLEPVDLVVTDPPYGIKFQSNHRRKISKTKILAGDDKPNTEFVGPLVKTLNADSAIYLCTRFDVYGVWQAALKNAGAKMKTTIVWDKGNWTAGDLRGDYGNQVELLLFAHIGRPFLRNGRPSNLWKIPRDPPGEHPTPKPVQLFTKCIENSSDAGNTVLDAFFGSGTCAVACIQAGRKFVGCEVEPKYFDLSCKRIEKAYRDFDNHFTGIL